MTFLSMAFLAALPLAAAPILLHLFDRRRSVVIEWGAMSFLMEASTKRTRARKLKQWILLALRVLALIALVLALAQPKIAGWWLGATDSEHLILVLDNSMSTQRELAEQVLFDRSIELARSEIAELSDGDTVQILTASPYPVWAAAEPIRINADSSQRIETTLTALKPTNGSSDLLSALFTTLQEESEDTVSRRRIVVITDGQASDWNTSDEKGWQRFHDMIETASAPTQFDVIRLSKETETSNVSVCDVQVSRSVVGIDQPFTVRVRIQNHSALASTAKRIQWLIDGEERHSELIGEIAPQESHEAVWHFALPKPGVYAVDCRIESQDSLTADNTGSVVLQVVDEVPVLVVESAAERNELQQDSYFLQAAMGFPGGEPDESRGVHFPEVITPAALKRINLASYRAVIIPNLRTIEEDTVRKLTEFVAEGGGLWLAAGPRTDIEAFNEFIFNGGDGLSPLAFDGVVSEKSNRKHGTTINPALRDHPAVRALSDTSKLDTGDVRIYRRARFLPTQDDNDVSVLLNLNNGEPLAVEKYVGRGRVIISGVPLRLDHWTELAKSHAFVVMVQDWLSYLTQPMATRHNLAPGDPISVQLADSEHSEATLTTPQGDEIALAADVQGDGTVFRSSRTGLPGTYTLELSLTGDQLPFYVARDELESNLEPLSPEESERLKQIGIGGNAMRSTTAVRQNAPVWHLLLILLIAFMVFELVLSGVIARERFGGEAISETAEEISEQGSFAPSLQVTSRQSFLQKSSSEQTTVNI